MGGLIDELRQSNGGEFRPRYGGANWAYDMGDPVQYPQPTLEQMLQAGLAVPGPLTAVYGGAGLLGGALYGGRQLMHGARLAREFPGMGVMGEFAKEAAKGATAFPAAMGGIGYAHDVGGRAFDWMTYPDKWQKQLAKIGGEHLQKNPPPGHFNYDNPWSGK